MCCGITAYFMWHILECTSEESLSAYPNHQKGSLETVGILKKIIKRADGTQCRNSRIFLSLRFYVKSILVILEVQKLSFFAIFEPLNFDF